MAGQDVTRNIEAGGSTIINLNGAGYIYCVQAADPVRISLDGDTMLMEAGDRHLIEGGAYDGQMIVENPNATPVAVSFNIGRGDFTKQIVKGELNVVPSIIKADGTIERDTRYWLDLAITPDQVFEGQTVEAGEIIERYQLRTWDGGRDASTRGYGAAFSPNGTVFLVDEVRNSSGDMYLDVSEYDVETGSVYRSITFGGFGPISGKEPQSLVYLDDNRLLMGTYSGQVWLLSWADQNGSVQIGTFAGEGASGVTGYATGAALGISADKSTLYWLVRSDALEFTVQKAPFDQGAISMGAVTTLLTETVSSYYTVVHAHWITEISGQVLFHIEYYRSAGEVFVDNVFDLDLNQQGDFGVNLGRFNPGATGNDTHVFHVEQRADGRLQSINEVRNGNTWYGVHWESDITFNARARVADAAEISGFNLLKPAASDLITANVSGVYQNNGRFVVTGEIIRYALQLYLGKLDIGDYLDKVYGIDIAETGGRPSWERIFSGNATFAREGVEDNFSVVLPGVVRLYVDQKLTRG